MGGLCSKNSVLYTQAVNTEKATTDLQTNTIGEKKNININNNNNNNNIENDSDESNSSEATSSGENIKTREDMVQYWKEHSSSNITKSLMLLMEDNPKFESTERKEIMTYLPNFENMDVIELGAGIGRFTDEIGKGGCKSLIAIDFMDKFIKENERMHGEKYRSQGIDMKFMCEDVTKLTLKKHSFDFVFSNWLMMYLDDSEVLKLGKKMYDWCRPGGFVFFRESCEGGASGDKPRTNNPTYYRKSEFYTNMFNNIAKECGDNNGKLTNISINKVKIYVDLKNKTNQYCWLYQKSQ